MIYSRIIMIMSLILPQGISYLCFPDTKEETCFSCSAEYYSSGHLYSVKSQSVQRSTCVKKNKTQILSRNILVGFYDENQECISQSINVNKCLEFLQFVSLFDAYYINFHDALSEENKILAEFAESFLSIHVFGEIAAYPNQNNFEGVEHFRRVFSKINIMALKCSDWRENEFCMNYTKTRPILLIKKQNLISIFVSAILAIRNISLRFVSSQDLRSSDSSLNLFTLEPIIDRIPFKSPELIITFSALEDHSEEYSEFTIFSVTKLGGSIRFESSSIQKWLSGCVIEVSNLTDIAYNDNETTTKINSLANENSSIVFMDLSISNIDFFSKFQSFTMFSEYQGEILFKDIVLRNFNFKNNQKCFTLIQNLKNEFVMVNVSISEGNIETFLSALGTKVYLEQIYLKNIHFQTTPLVFIFHCEKSDINKLEISGLSSDNIAQAGPIISVQSCSDFSLRNSKFLMIDGFNIQVRSSSSKIIGSNFVSLNYTNYIWYCLLSNCTFENSIFSELEGPGVIFEQFRENLIIMNSKISFVKGIVVINFDELQNNIIANCEISFINNPQYFWARNLYVVKQLLLNNTFSNSYFLRVQSFYRQFDFYPLLIYKDGLFVNMTFGLYGFDFCCLDLFVINVTFLNIEMLKGSDLFFTLEQNGNFAFFGSKFIDVGWNTYEETHTVAFNQRIIFLWYPGSFSMKNCEFLLRKIMSIRSGFINCQDFNKLILIENCSFVSKHFSIDFPIKGFIFFSIFRIEIKNCLFVNLTADVKSMAYTHINGVLSFLGSLSLLENKVNSNSILFENVTMENVIAKNGAALTVVSYNQFLIVNCSFFNGTAIEGVGGLMAVVFIKQLSILSSIFSKGRSLSGGHLYFKEIGYGFISDCEFENSEAQELGGSISLLSCNTLMKNSKFIKTKSLGIGGIAYQHLGSLVLLNISSNDSQTHSEGGVFYCENADNLSTTNASFAFVKAGGKGGMIFGELRNIIMNNVNCTNIQNEDDGTFFFLENFENILVSKSTNLFLVCHKNCKKGLTIAKTSVQETIFYLGDVVFGDCQTLQGSILQLFSDTTLNLINVAIFNWKGGKIFWISGISSIEVKVINTNISRAWCSDLSLFDFKNAKMNISSLNLLNSSIKSNIINLIQCYAILKYVNFLIDGSPTFHDVSHSYFFIDISKLYLFNYSLVFSKSPESFIFFFYFSNSDFNFEDSTFITNVDSRFIEAIDSNISIRNISALDSSKTGKDKAMMLFISKFSGAKLIIESSSLKVSLGTCLRVRELENIFISNSNFSANNVLSSLDVCAIHVDQMESMIIYDSNFEYFIGKQGAGILIDYPNNILSLRLLIFGCLFKNLKSESGAVLSINSRFDILIKGCRFENNIASFSQINRASGIGSVGFFNCIPNKLFSTKSCLIEMKNNSFSGNLAAYHSTIFSNTNISSEENIFPPENETGASSNMLAYPIQVNFIKNGLNTSLIEVQSGNPETFIVVLADSFGQELR